jgi:hypothetical protein
MLAVSDQKLRVAFGAAIVWFFAGLWAMSVLSTWGVLHPSGITGEICPVIHLGFGLTTGMAATSDAAVIYYLTRTACASYYVLTLPSTLLLLAGVFLLVRLFFRKTGLSK